MSVCDVPLYVRVCPYDVRTMPRRMSVVCPWYVRMCVADEEHDEAREEEDFRQGRGQGA